MKLRNKRTGEIGKPAFIGVDYEITILPEDKNKKARYYNSLAELNAEWCDYEEPKEYWAIDIYSKGAEDFKNSNDDVDKFNKEIGNYFETKEEAEKAEKKLQAWTRLKDKGFRFDGYDVAHNSNGDLCGQLFYNAGDYCIEDVEKDLDLLFCPEAKNE